ncbi:MAG: PEP-CTERM sorting domain-containing protein [Microcoleus sp. PH2017_29_MFU_D_A]|uniref:PEP-CTERM sorting domain-containing protein n=1 Tax=Microcoleus sp. PH2017_29_MFU_D_A TaxID=2798839 RepID=UPI001D9CF596|nr:PEP-CTERM sorting domain-containing protein [Microcoleus sp. PH2017_29_MFU_D_A]MCC3607721.1 PEP-CTERM sorting domain-containing protein [Microcoleus sp. PH2017_29_MFU_D_A]
MNQKQRQRLGSAIGSTILSYAALSLVGVDKTQAAVLTYNFQVEKGGGSGFFKFSDSSLTGIGSEKIAVGVYKNDYDLAGAIALFNQGNFRGLQASGVEYATREEARGGTDYIKFESRATWYMGTEEAISTWASYFWGYGETIVSNRQGYLGRGRTIISSARVSYSLVDTAAEPVPEPITFAGTGLALAGLSWLKHKKKMAA